MGTLTPVRTNSKINALPICEQKVGLVIPIMYGYSDISFCTELSKTSLTRHPLVEQLFEVISKIFVHKSINYRINDIIGKIHVKYNHIIREDL